MKVESRAFFLTMRIFTSIIFSLMCTMIFAQADGYYRVKNHKTQRYITVVDKKGSVNLSTSDADLGALVTIKGFDRVVSDVSSVIHIKKVPSAGGYNFETQGVDTYGIIGYYVKLRNGTVSGTYRAYAQHGSMVKYLCDENWDGDEGWLNTSSAQTQNWYILPVSSEGDNYFGVTPSINLGAATYYHAFYAAFPFELASAGMTAYYVDFVDGGLAVWKEVANGVVPAAAPVILKMKSDKASNNRLDFLESTPTKLSGNVLKGVYFNNDGELTNGGHINQTKYDPATMRVLGKMKDGSLGFITDKSLDYLPANSAYLKVSKGSPEEIKLVTEEEYEVLAGVDDIFVDKKPLVQGIYSICGVKLSDDVSSLNTLPAGIYIVDGKKVVVGKK